MYSFQVSLLVKNFSFCFEIPQAPGGVVAGDAEKSARGVKLGLWDPPVVPLQDGQGFFGGHRPELDLPIGRGGGEAAGVLVHRHQRPGVPRD